MKYWWQGNNWNALVRYNPNWQFNYDEKLDVGAAGRYLGDGTCYSLSWAYGLSALAF